MIYVLLEYNPSCVRVIKASVCKSDLLAILASRFDDELAQNDFAFPDGEDHDDYAFIDNHGGCIGDTSKESGWIYWEIQTTFLEIGA